MNEAYLPSCARMGIAAYRGNPRPGTSRMQRALRFADGYVGLRDNTGELSAGGLPVDVPGSRFLRPYSKRLPALEPLRLRRICSELSAAAESGRVYHLWWHPHNFGVDLRENLAFLEAVLQHFDKLRGARGMLSLNMAECAAPCVAMSLDAAMVMA